MENKGFKNCPSVTKFVVGMHVKRLITWHKVLDVDKDGFAWCRHDRDNDFHTLDPLEMGNLELDLSSIWVGREYQRKDGRGVVVYVVMSCDNWVAFHHGNWGNPSCVPQSVFCDEWKPLPLPIPAAPEPVKEWVPQPGRKCKSGCGDIVTVEELWRDTYAWVVDENGNGRPHAIDKLSPLPPEPPLKVGDKVLVEWTESTKRNGFAYGVVTGATPNGAYVLSSNSGHGSSSWLRDERFHHFDESRFTVLAPAES